jgi:hypothetical protein
LTDDFNLVRLGNATCVRYTFAWHKSNNFISYLHFIIFCWMINRSTETSGWKWAARCLVFYVVFCKSLFVLLSFFFLSVCCLTFLDLRLLVTFSIFRNIVFDSVYILSSYRKQFLDINNLYQLTNRCLKVLWIVDRSFVTRESCCRDSL